MNLNPYRQALALPGFRSLLLVSTFARVPTAMAAITLTLYVVEELGRGYAAAGVVAAAVTIGAALGAPLMGRLADRRGLRPVLLLTTTAEALFWTSAPSLPYHLLIGAAFVGGLLMLPIYSISRQSIAALAPPAERRQAYALDSMSVELSFIVGPSVAVLLVTSISAHTTLYLVGAGIVAAGVALYLLNPPIRSAAELRDTGAPVPVRQWLTPRLVGVLLISATATLVVGGTDVALVAMTRAADQVQWTGLVIGAWASASLVGGFAYGAAARSPSPLALLVGLSLATLPVGLAGGSWWMLALALIPAGLLCAPTLASTADALSRLAPAPVRGLVMGLHGSSVTVGTAMGAPLAGAVIDRWSPGWGFVVIGLAGLAAAALVLPANLRHRRTPAPPPARAPLTPTP